MKHNKCVKKEIPRETTRGILRKYIRYVHVVFYLFYLLIYIIKTINFALPRYISDLDLSNSTIDSKGLFNPSQSVSLVLFDSIFNFFAEKIHNIQHLQENTRYTSIRSLHTTW